MSEIATVENSTDITPITLPTPIEWSSKKDAAKAHVEKILEMFEKVEYHSLYMNALFEVSKEMFVKERTENALYWSTFLLGDSVEKLKNFFMEWLEYTPVPKNPGKYIMRWDYLANTLPGLVLIEKEGFKNWFREFLNFHGDWINSTSSTDTLEAWMKYGGTTGHPFNIKNYQVPEGGFKSFNQFFLRNLKEGQRPLCMAEPKGDVVAAPCDGGIFYLHKESTDGTVVDNTKTKYHLPGKSNDHISLNGAIPGYDQFFKGGPLLDILLWFTDYHHFHAPVSGKVIHQKLYPGSYNYDVNDFNPFDPDAKLPAENSDEVGWYHNIGKHQRYVWVIETEDLGKVAMIAIGFWGVGSIINAVEENARVEKGQYMGHFGYGGSSIVLAFEPNKGMQFKVGDKDVTGPNDPTLMKVRQCIGKKMETLNW